MKQNSHLVIAILMTNIILIGFAYVFTEAMIVQMRITEPFMKRVICTANPYQCWLRRHPLKVINLRYEIPNRID